MIKSIQQLRARLVSVCGVTLRTFDDDLLQARGEHRVPLAYGVHLVRRRTRVVTRHQMIHSSAQTVDVRSGVGLTVTAVLLGSGVSLGTQTGGILNAGGFKLSGGTEVDQAYVAVRLEHDVGRFHVTIYDGGLSGVEVTENIAQLF